MHGINDNIVIEAAEQRSRPTVPGIVAYCASGKIDLTATEVNNAIMQLNADMKQITPVDIFT